MVLGKLPVPGVLLIGITVEQGLTALAVGAVGVVWTILYARRKRVVLCRALRLSVS